MFSVWLQLQRFKQYRFLRFVLDMAYIFCIAQYRKYIQYHHKPLWLYQILFWFFSTPFALNDTLRVFPPKHTNFDGLLESGSVTRFFLHFFNELNPPRPLVNRLNWFCWTIRFCGDIRDISDSTPTNTAWFSCFQTSPSSGNPGVDLLIFLFLFINIRKSKID